MDLKTLFGLRPKADTAEALRASLAAAEAELGASRARLAALESRTAEMLLDAAPAEAEQHEAAIEAERRQVQRLAAIVAALPPRISAAEQREASDALERERVEAEAIAAQASGLIREIERASRNLLLLTREHDAAARKVVAINARLSAAGRREDRVALPTARVWGVSLADLAAAVSVPSPRGPFAAKVVVASMGMTEMQRRADVTADYDRLLDRYGPAGERDAAA